jgi:nitroreductase
MTDPVPAGRRGGRTGEAATLPPYEEILTLTCRAPSIHNTQPWFWRVTDRGLDLLADRSRRLVHADPEQRNLVLSCGAALHHLQVVAAGLGWRATVDRSQDATEPWRLASVALTPTTVTLRAAQRLHAVMVRQTDRRRPTDAPVTPEQLASLSGTAARWGAQATAVTDVDTIAELMRLDAEADDIQRSDEGYLFELAAWAQFRRHDGLRPELIPQHRSATSPHAPGRFPEGELLDEAPAVGRGGVTALLLVTASSDDTLSRLRAGEAMSDVWLTATEAGLSVVPMSQSIEVAVTRERIIAALLDGRTFPQILLTVGHLPPDRQPLPRSPRRPVGDVIVRG